MARIQLVIQQSALARLRALQSAQLNDLMADIGETLLNSTRERFETQTAPDGTPWAALSETTKARKKRNSDKILIESGDLMRELTWQLSSNGLELQIGSDRKYAGTQQFGAKKGQYGIFNNKPTPWGDIPARPFLGLSTGDIDDINAIIADHLQSRLQLE